MELKTEPPVSVANGVTGQFSVRRALLGRQGESAATAGSGGPVLGFHPAQLCHIQGL